MIDNFLERTLMAAYVALILSTLGAIAVGITIVGAVAVHLVTD